MNYSFFRRTGPLKSNKLMPASTAQSCSLGPRGALQAQHSCVDNSPEGICAAGIDAPAWEIVTDRGPGPWDKFGLQLQKNRESMRRLPLLGWSASGQNNIAIGPSHCTATVVAPSWFLRTMLGCIFFKWAAQSLPRPHLGPHVKHARPGPLVERSKSDFMSLKDSLTWSTKKAFHTLFICKQTLHGLII